MPYRLDPSAAPWAWTGFVLSNACCTAVLSRIEDRRFHALYDKVARSDVLWKAWGEVRANRGAPGVDGITIDDVVDSGVSEFLEELAAKLQGRYVSAAAAAAGVHPEAGQAGSVAAARHPLCGRPGGDGGGEDRARADLRSRLPARPATGFGPGCRPITRWRRSDRPSPGAGSNGCLTPTFAAALTKSITTRWSFRSSGGCVIDGCSSCCAVG